MSEVKAKVAEHHFKGQVNVGGKTLRKDRETSVEPNTTLRNMVQAGNVIIVEGNLSPERDEKQFQRDDTGGEESKSLDEMTKDELKELAEQKDLKKSGTKSEIKERIRDN
jgi:hypothetical protein